MFSRTNTHPTPLKVPWQTWAVGAAIAAALCTVGYKSTTALAAPSFKAVSANGEVVFFETDEQLVPGDTDTRRDVYERYYDSAVGQYVTREVSIGPTGGNDSYPAQFEAANADGTEVFFSTEERLVAADTDRQEDLYMRDLTSGTTTLVSVGEAACQPSCGNGSFPITFAGINETGTEAFFTTQERLVGADTDDSIDLYMRNLVGGTTTLVSTGEAACRPGCGNGEFDVSPRGISDNGAYAYFTTAEPLASADGDTALDIYAHSVITGETSLVSQGACAGCGNGGRVPLFDGSSADGKRVFFSTDESLTPGDGDTATDIYARDLPNGPTTLVSGGGEDITASYAASSADGAHVFFTTAEGLLGTDDGVNEIYEWTEGGPLRLVTSAPCTADCGVTFDAVSADSEEVIFSTAAALSAEDEDDSEDIYRQSVSGGAPVLVSRGESACRACWNGEYDATFNKASADASQVVIGTTEGVLADDTDGEPDIYLRDLAGGSTSLITTSPSYCPLRKGSCGATFVGASADGRQVFFRTFERFTLEDGDNEADIYERSLGATPVTRLVSTGNSPDLELGPPAPVLTATDPTSPAASRTPRIVGETEAGAIVKLYATPDCSGEPVAAGTGAELAGPGLQVTVTAGSSSSFRATAEKEGFVSTCSQSISYRQLEESSGGGGAGPGGTGHETTHSGSVTTTTGAGGGSGPAATAGQASPALVPPRALVTFGPAAKTRSRRPVFRFTDSTRQIGTRFRCRIDKAPWKPCASPLRLRRLGRGRHVLKILAISAAGTAQVAPTRRAFRVVPR
jgi:Tol biopolymer transport system component